MVKLLKILLITIFLGSPSIAEIKFGVEGGLLYADMRAEETAQTLANLSGSTVTYEYDEATWQGRFFADYAINDGFHAEIGYFISGSLDATYKISGDSATESYDAMGIDAAGVFYADDLFFKAGMHSSELNGAASLKIGSTTYNISDSISGSGFLVGGGVDTDGSRVGLTYYSDLGGDSNSDATFLYYGVKF